MKLTPAQILCTQEWNQLIAVKAEAALGSELNGRFTAANYPAGFNYHVMHNDYYNSESLKCLDTLVDVKDGIPYLNTGYSTLYKRVMEKIHFNISKEDLLRINQEANRQEALVTSIIKSYKQSDIDEEPMKNPTVGKIMERIKKFTGTSYYDVDLREYPYLANLCNLLTEFTRKATFTSKIQRASDRAGACLDAIIKHINNPDDDNGGLKTEDGFACGWDNIKEPAQLLDELEGSKSIKITVSANNFHEKSSSLNLKNDVKVDVPVNWFFNLGAEHEDEYDISKFAKNGAEMSITVIYDGVTLVPANPTKVSPNNKEGWYDETILDEVAAKTGKDVTGYQLVDSEFDVETLFGEDGKLRRMRTLVISQHPIVRVTFKKFDCSELKKKFDETTDVEFSMFGGIISGHHKNSYSISECKYDKSSESLDVTFMPRPLGSSGTALSQTAYVIGGVVDYIKNDVEVKKIRILTDEVKSSDEPDDKLKELEGLHIMYRKNEEGRYEYAGLYDENEDIDYMLGDTVAVPVTSDLIGVVELLPGTSVWNVQGSANDKCNQYKSLKWMSIWERETHGARRCYVCHDPQCNRRNQTLVGAHLVLQGDRVRPVGEDVFYIVPICNGMNNRGRRNQMIINQRVMALQLNHFLEWRDNS